MTMILSCHSAMAVILNKSLRSEFLDKWLKAIFVAKSLVAKGFKEKRVPWLFHGDCVKITIDKQLDSIGGFIA